MYFIQEEEKKKPENCSWKETTKNICHWLVMIHVPLDVYKKYKEMVFNFVITRLRGSFENMPENQQINYLKF